MSSFSSSNGGVVVFRVEFCYHCGSKTTLLQKQEEQERSIKLIFIMEWDNQIFF